MSNEQCAMCNMCRLLNDLDFPLLIAHCSLLISGARFRGSMRERYFRRILSPRCCIGNVNGAGRGIKGTAIELRGIAASGLLPLPARNEWGEGRGEGNPNKNGPPLPGPLLPLWGGEGEFLAASPVLFLNSMAVPPLPPPTFPF